MRRHFVGRRGVTFLAGLVLALVVPPAGAAPCNVPSVPHPTLGAAVADPACSPIQVAAGTYTESLILSRDVVMQGAGSTTTVVRGLVRASGTGVDVILAGLRIDAGGVAATGCSASALESRGGAQVTAGLDLDVRGSGVVGTGCVIFADGFESGTTGAWSGVPP